jgi:Protein of unknown function (DUF3306).
MSDPESFLERWSRRKNEASSEPEPTPERKDAAAAPPPQSAEEQGAQPCEPFDITQLPSIDSIGADSDVTAFLRPGVPAELTRAALRRAWSSDPAIRDFVGLVENGWDFNDPDAVPGFGRIAAKDVARLLTQAMGAPEPDVPAAGPPRHVSEQNDGPTDRPIPDAGPAVAPASEETPATVQCNIKNDASQHEDQG